MSDRVHPAGTVATGTVAPKILANPVLVGRFGAAHGVRGEVRLQSFTQDPKAIGHYGPLVAMDGRRFELTSVRLVKDTMLVVRVKGVADRTAAEALTHIDLFIERAALPPPDEEEFYIADLVGLEAIDASGETIGRIVDVPNYGGGDLVEVKPTTGGETLLYPFTKECVPTIDIAGRRVTIVPPDEVEEEGMSQAEWRADVFTLFPAMFPGPLGLSLAGDGLQRGVWRLMPHDIRDHGLGRHRAVDDTPAGGGAGMVMRADVVAASLDAQIAMDDPRPRLLMSPRGQPLTQARVRDLVAGPGVIILCGRFEGVDERIIAARRLEEVSIGDYILSGGELPALALLDACVRLLPGIMGHDASGDDESFESGLLEYPQYTRPRDFEGLPIPDILLSGDHGKIADWRKAEALRLTRARRPDLLAPHP